MPPGKASRKARRLTPKWFTEKAPWLGSVYEGHAAPQQVRSRMKSYKTTSGAEVQVIQQDYEAVGSESVAMEGGAQKVAAKRVAGKYTMVTRREPGKGMSMVQVHSLKDQPLQAGGQHNVRVRGSSRASYAGGGQRKVAFERREVGGKVFTMHSVKLQGKDAQKVVFPERVSDLNAHGKRSRQRRLDLE